MRTRTSIANNALLRIGVSQTMTDLDTDTSREAISSRVLFDDEREYCLRDFNWPFARKYLALTLVEGSVGSPANPDFIFGYAFPVDCLYVRRIVNCFGRQATSPPPFIIGRAAAGGRMIFCNQENAMAEYSVDVTDVAEFDPHFASMFEWRLGAMLALSLSRLTDVFKSCMEMYTAERGEAISRAAAEAEYAIATGEADPAVREIFNLAITRLGISRNVVAVDPELTFAALWPRVSFAQERDYVLREWAWPFATKYELLTLAFGTSTVPANGDWTFAYRFPDGCLYVRRLVTSAGRNELHPPKFAIGSGIVNPTAAAPDQVRGRLIYTNEPTATAEFTDRITDPAEFDPLFESLLAWRIAALLAPSIGKTKTDPNIVTRCNQGYELEKIRATRAARSEGQDEDPPDAEWIRGRS